MHVLGRVQMTNVLCAKSNGNVVNSLFEFMFDSAREKFNVLNRPYG